MVMNEAGDMDCARLLLLLWSFPGVCVSTLRRASGGGARCPSGISWGYKKTNKHTEQKNNYADISSLPG